MISFNSSRRLEVSRVELLLQVGTFCVAIGALVAGTEFGWLFDAIYAMGRTKQAIVLTKIGFTLFTLKLTSELELG